MKQPLIILLALTTFTTLPAFAINRVLSLNGDGDYVEIEDSKSLNAINSQVTMEAWIKATALSNVWMPIIYKGDERTSNLDNRSYNFWLRNDGALGLHSAPSGQRAIFLPSASGLITLKRWFHIAGVIDAKNGVSKVDFRFASFKKGAWITFNHLDGLVGNHINDIHIDKHGYLWVATWSGVSRFDGDEFVNYTAKDGLARNWVSTIYEDRQGRFWFGTGSENDGTGEGVSCYEPRLSRKF